MRVESESVSQSGYGSPRVRDVGHKIVVGGAGEECLIAMTLSIIAAVLFEIVCVGRAEGGIDRSHNHDS